MAGVTGDTNLEDCGDLGRPLFFLGRPTSLVAQVRNPEVVFGEMRGACSALVTGRPGLPGMAHTQYILKK